MELLLSIDLILRYLAQRDEDSRQRMRLAAAQMRPHFIHNALISLYDLCEMDPEQARRVIRDFTRYLQNNFTAIAEEHPILFKKEPEHTQAYLAVEQACNEGRLFVAFDTPSIYFRVPRGHGPPTQQANEQKHDPAGRSSSSPLMRPQGSYIV